MKLKTILHDLRQDLINQIFGAFGLPVDYAPESIQRMEDFFNLFMRKPDGEYLNTTAIPFGFYLGETMVQHIDGAEWSFPDDDESIFDVAVRVTDANGKHLEVFPFRRVLNFFNDPTDGLAVMYRMVSLMASSSLLDKAVQSTETDGQWITFPNGDMYRTSRVEKVSSKEDDL